MAITSCHIFFNAHMLMLFSLRNGLLELFLGFCLRLGEDALVDGLAGGRIIACGVASLPAAILTLADATLTVCTFLRHGINSFSW
jgi:hypothetical protein